MWFRRSKPKATVAAENDDSPPSDTDWGDQGLPVDELRCSFCAKRNYEVRKLIAGPLAFICDECVKICGDIIAHDERFEAAQAGTRTPSSPPGTAPVDDATMAAMLERVAALCASDQWSLVLHLLARLRTRDAIPESTNQT